jgi:hypothetical protein
MRAVACNKRGIHRVRLEYCPKKAAKRRQRDLRRASRDRFDYRYADTLSEFRHIAAGGSSRRPTWQSHKNR